MYPPPQPSLPYPLKSYRTVATQTASPGQLVLMLYDGAIRALERALTGFQHQDPLDFNQTINNNLLHAWEIINELDNSLDLARGGELAATLRRLNALRDAWSQMLRQREQPAAAEPFEALAAVS